MLDTRKPAAETATVSITLGEHNHRGRAIAHLLWADSRITGRGLSRLDTDDATQAPIGRKLALARALADVTRQLFAEIATDIEATLPDVRSGL